MITNRERDSWRMVSRDKALQEGSLSHTVHERCLAQALNCH